jgi:hypothetical protein
MPGTSCIIKLDHPHYQSPQRGLQAMLGGAVVAYNTALQINTTVIKGNAAVDQDGTSSAVQFLKPHASGDCGALLLWQCSKVLLRECIVEGNVATGHGGGICLRESQATMTAIVAHGNKVSLALPMLPKRCHRLCTGAHTSSGTDMTMHVSDWVPSVQPCWYTWLHTYGAIALA